ncbi:hypothetical protein PAECIP111802_06002 [Paenibacillus allorhizosphaerae]|uniref:Uncharacterized protein n=1 Tax=Paenibacillus allorhizosphaerae TaxID=2849866 RepID=A0ABM8VRI6_9BACL|nr:hypothetical protein PAECIP111802_06002 [Paenibacillus allorhizosphaerae]
MNAVKVQIQGTATEKEPGKVLSNRELNRALLAHDVQ